MKVIEGGVTAAQGFEAAGTARCLVWRRVFLPVMW